MRGGKSVQKFFPEIEALRAIAVIMTMLAHFIPKNSPFYVSYLWFGVDLFFTISGFLITYILFINIYSDKQQSTKMIVKNFFVRRILRLFPAYYAFIILFFILRNVFSIYIWKNEYNFYFFTYLQNMYYFFQGSLNSVFSHLWSLGVEEQFYIVWPFLILLVPLRNYMKVFALMIVVSLGLNFIFQNNVGAFRVLVFANMHTLGAGAFLAYLYYFNKQNRILNFIVTYRVIFFVASLLALVFFINVKGLDPDARIILMEISLMCTTFFAVMTSILGWPSYTGFIFNNRIIHHIGKVSYGIYLYHMLIPISLSVIIMKIPAMGFLMPSSLWMRVLMFMLYSYGIATISYYFFEIHFLRLKSKFV